MRAVLVSSVLAAAALASGVANAQEINHDAPFPDVTYPYAVSSNPNVVQGTRSNQTSPPKYPSPWGTGAGDWNAAYAKAIALVEQMTLDEKVNLTTGTGWSLESCVGQTGAVPRLGIRSLCLQDSPTAIRFSDFNSVFPPGVNVAATFDRGLARARGQALGEEFRDKGANSILGPVAGPLGRAPEGGRNWEGFSPDPYLTGVLFAETIQGIQSTGMIATAKHFVANEQENFRQVGEAIGYGFNISQPGSSNIDDQTLHELYMWPFADGIRAGAASVMCSYNLLNNSQACQNSYLMNYLLKGELGFQGFIVSDWQATAAGSPAILAGLDMTMPGDVKFDDGRSYFGPNLTIAVLNGTVPQWRLDDMAVRVLAGWFHVNGDAASKPVNFNSWSLDTYGPIHNYVGPEFGYGLINEHVDVRQQHGALIRELGAASTVLLKNDGVLPLTGCERLTAVFGEDAGANPAGPNACSDHGCDEGTLGIGWGSGQGNFPYLVTPDAALQEEVTRHYGAYESIVNNSALTQIQALARRTAQVAGVCIAFANADSGEGFIDVDGNYGDRKNLTFWQGAEPMLANVTATCNNTILVIHATAQVAIEKYKHHPNVTAIVWAGVPGEQSGYALADVLYGRVNPAARLPFTIGKKRSDYGTDVLYQPNGPVPQFDFKEGGFIDYRHYDRFNITPTYEFGFGLSYTTFNYSNLRVNKFPRRAYVPLSSLSGPAPTYGTITNDSAAYLFPANITRVPLFIYPWLNSSNLEEAYGGSDYGDWSFVPAGALDGSPISTPPAGGASGGHPVLWDVLYSITVDVTNSGSRAGWDVPQLYLSLGGRRDPKVVLRGFERIWVDPGQTVPVSFDLTRRDLSNWDTKTQNWIISNHTKVVHLGSSSRSFHLQAALS